VTGYSRKHWGIRFLAHTLTLVPSLLRPDQCLLTGYNRTHQRFGFLEHTLICKFLYREQCLFDDDPRRRGGGNVYNVTLDRSRPPLRWMASQAAEFGLRIGSFVRELLVEEQVQLRESLTLPWKIFELYPFRRLTYSRTRINTTTRG
jgi:hypothetical protein